MDNGVSTVIVHPIVLLSVLDHHNRRQEGGGRVIGTLLGKREGDRVSW
jgi:translation initiation factor 3 subunit F